MTINMYTTLAKHALQPHFWDTQVHGQQAETV